TEDELKAAMHEKTRYNIGLAERKGVMIRCFDYDDETPSRSPSERGRQLDGLDDFMRLLDETVRRDKIKTYGRGYFESILNSADDNFNAKIWLAHCSPPLTKGGSGGVDQPIAAAFNVYFDQTATYLFGASSDEHRNLMAPHLLQWKMIADAKSRGYKYYDFWGINPKDEKSPNYYPKWEGFSRFKRGFAEKSGTSLELLYGPCLELPISKFWYKIFKLVKKII
ncbi:MAG: peptidoglycan bridge formation glycyltransferase FemA/FemB family protein, partial [Patescibacteria group bacterium]